MGRKVIIISILTTFSAVVISSWAYLRYAPKKHGPNPPGSSTTAIPTVYIDGSAGDLDRIYIVLDNIFHLYINVKDLENYLNHWGHVVLRNGNVQLVKEIDKKTDYIVTYEGIIVRNEVLKYNWCMKTKQFYYLRDSDAILRKYGLIMRKIGSRYVPEHLGTGTRLEFFANQELIERAVKAVNFYRTIFRDFFDPEHGKDMFDVETFLLFDKSNKTIDSSLDLLGIDITGKELLDLYGVKIRWNEKEQKYEIASRLPESGPGILGPKDLELLKESARRFPLDIDLLEGGMYDTVNPLDIYFLTAGLGFSRIAGEARHYEAYDKTTDRSLYIMERHNFPSSTAAIPVIYCKLLEKTSRVLLEKYKALAARAQPPESAQLDSMIRHYDQLQQNYSNWNHPSLWHDFLGEVCRTSIRWTQTGFEVRDAEKITFPRDDDLIKETLNELNYYREKVDFTSHFQIENYPMFLLSILRLYDVNLELGKGTNKYVIAPGPTDQQKFFKIVSEFTFVNGPSDTEYIKKHLTSWLDSPKEAKKSSATD